MTLGLVSLLALAVVGSLTVACGADSKPSNWQGEGVSLVWDEGWEWDSGVAVSMRSVFEGPVLCTLVHRSPKSWIVLMGRELKAGETLRSVFTGTYDRVATEHPGWLRDLQEGATTVDGLSALVMAYERPSGELLYDQWDVWWQVDGRVFVLSGWTYPQSAEQMRADFDNIVRNLEIAE